MTDDAGQGTPSPRRELELELLDRWRSAMGDGDVAEVTRLVNASHTIRDGAAGSQARGATLGWAHADPDLPGPDLTDRLVPGLPVMGQESSGLELTDLDLP